MRLARYINEDMESDFFENIKTECKEILEFYSKNPDIFLYRGEKKWSTYFNSPVNKKREPRNSTKLFHNEFNSGFKDSFNIKARSETLFCTGAAEETKQYGNAFIIFPTGSFEVYWSPKIDDIAEFNWCNKIVKNELDINIIAFVLFRILTYSVSFSTLKVIFDKNKDKFNECLESIKMKAEDIIDKRKEFNFGSLIASNEKIAKKLIKHYPNCSKEFVHKYYKKGSLKSGIKSGNELMIDCVSYYALSKSNYENKIQKLFQK